MTMEKEKDGARAGGGYGRNAEMKVSVYAC